MDIMELSEDEVAAWNVFQDSRFLMLALEEEKRWQDAILAGWSERITSRNSCSSKMFLKNIQDPDERDDVDIQIELLQYTVSEAEQNIGNLKAQVKLKWISRLKKTL